MSFGIHEWGAACRAIAAGHIDGGAQVYTWRRRDPVVGNGDDDDNNAYALADGFVLPPQHWIVSRTSSMQIKKERKEERK